MKHHHQKLLLLFFTLFFCNSVTAQQPHQNQIQNATDCSTFIQNTMNQIEILGKEEFAKKLWINMSGGKVLSGTETSTQTTNNYNRNLNPAQKNSWVSRIYQDTALSQIKKYQLPSKSYWYDNLILFAETRWNLATKNKIVNKYNEINTSIDNNENN